MNRNDRGAADHQSRVFDTVLRGTVNIRKRGGCRRETAAEVFPGFVKKIGETVGQKPFCPERYQKKFLKRRSNGVSTHEGVTGCLFFL